MALNFNGSTSGLSLSGSAGGIVAGFSFTMFCWVRSEAPLQIGFPFVLEVKAADASNAAPNSIGIFLDASKARAFSSTGSSVSAFSTTAVAAGSWRPVMAVFNAQSGTDARRIWYSSGAVVSDNSSSLVTPAQISTVGVGVRSIPVDNRFKGDVACCAIWSTALTQTDFDTLAAGAVPSTVQTGSLVEYWSLLTQAATHTGVNGRVLTGGASTTQSSSHPITEVGDTTPPTLSSPSGTGGALTCSGSVTTNEANGTLYTVFTASATAPTAAQVKSGQDHTGTAALRAVSQSVSATGSQAVASGSITAGTRYAHFMHEDAATNQSTVASSASFVVTSGGGGTTPTPYFFHLMQPRS